MKDEVLLFGVVLVVLGLLSYFITRLWSFSVWFLIIGLGLIIFHRAESTIEKRRDEK